MDNFEKVIGSIKRQLVLNDPGCNKQASFILLTNILEIDEEAFLIRLVDSGIISNVTQIINPETQGCILKSIEIITKSDVFYKNDLVNETITSITRCDFTQSQEEATVALNIIHKVVTKVFEFNESQGASLIQRHADGLLCFFTQPAFDQSSLLSATKLFNFIIKYSAQDFKRTHFSNMGYIYRLTVDHLLSLEVGSELDRIRTICCISTSVISLCFEIGDTECKELYANKFILFDLIKFIATEKVIPLLQKLDIDIESAEDFVEFLETVINLREYKNEEICVPLLKNGYLKYLLELSVFEPERHCFRRKVCRVIAKIIVALKEYLELPTNDWLGGSAAFQNFLSTGLGSLPIDFQSEDLLKKSDQNSNSLLVLLYCHFLGTHEKYVFTQKSLTLKLMSVVKRTTEAIFLKAVFLLYSVSALSLGISNSPSNARSYSKAITSLVTTMQKRGRIELFYTHHEDLLIYSIREIGIPEGLRNKVIQFWLDKSNTDKEFDALIKECLNQGYGELKIVKLFMGFVHENCMEHLNNVTEAYGALLRYRDEIPEDVVVFVLQTLADDLDSYTPSDSHILKIVLRFACSLPTSNSVSTSILRKCAINIGKILVQEETDFVLRALLITQAAFTIRHSLSLNDSKVAETFLRNDEFLNQVFNSSFFSKGITMAHSIRTLTCLIFCQKKFNLQCKSVSQVTFKDLKTLLINMRENMCNPTLGAELIKLLLINTVNNPLIVLYISTNCKHLRYILDVYFLVHNIHDESLPGKEEQTYECLSAMLDYTFAQKFNINVLLTCAATPDLVEIATDRILKSNLLNLSFLDFATKWLTYRQGFRQHSKMKIKSFAEKSADILIDFRPLVDRMKNESCVIVEDFCTAVENYFKNFPYLFINKG